MAIKENKNHDVKLIVLTVLACGIVAGAIVFHILATRNSYLKGYQDGGNAIKSILINK